MNSDIKLLDTIIAHQINKRWRAKLREDARRESRIGLLNHFMGEYDKQFGGALANLIKIFKIGAQDSKRGTGMVTHTSWFQSGFKSWLKRASWSRIWNTPVYTIETVSEEESARQRKEELANAHKLEFFKTVVLHTKDIRHYFDIKIVRTLEDGSILCEWATPEDSWMALAGRGGYLKFKDGEVFEYNITRMS